ncbi:MAG: peptidylprolyl isomerase [Myxococcales bacterium]|nr:peptidylprolyl isomerase [Myxococcales bacterium]
MNVATSIKTLVGMAAALLGWLAIHERDEAGISSVTPAGSASSAASSSASSPTDSASPGAGGNAPSEPSPGTGGQGVGIDPDLDPDAEDGSGGGVAVPTLQDAPKSVEFGVVLVQYSGAQGAKKDARSKAEAQKLAEELLTVARDDFEAAVKKGDPGSVTSAGKMFRGILEPNVEYALFSLEEGAVSGVVDTPRGFWIIKRTD